MLGVPIVPTIASTGWGVDRLLDTVIDVYEMRNPDTRHIHIKMRPEVEQAVSAINDSLKKDPSVSQKFSPRYLAIKLLEHDPEVEHILEDNPRYSEWCAIRDRENFRIERELGDDANSIIASEKYGFVQGALAETFKSGENTDAQSTKIIDAFVTNKLFGRF